MLTARGDEADRVVGLEMGRRRLRHQTVQVRGIDRAGESALRRAEPAVDSRAPRHRQVVHRPGILPGELFREVGVAQHPGIRLLYYLASRPNRVFTRTSLLDAVVGYGSLCHATKRGRLCAQAAKRKSNRTRESASPEDRPRAGYLFETRAA